MLVEKFQCVEMKPILFTLKRNVDNLTLACKPLLNQALKVLKVQFYLDDSISLVNRPWRD